jgi:hypothetical protein
LNVIVTIKEYVRAWLITFAGAPTSNHHRLAIGWLNADFEIDAAKRLGTPGSRFETSVVIGRVSRNTGNG